MPAWPDWWEWELEFTPHVIKRMDDRGFDEIDLRLMLELAESLKPDKDLGRWILYTHHDGEPWRVVVEPDHDDQVLVVITAFLLH